MSDNKVSLYSKVINIVLDIMIVLFGIVLLISIYNNVQVKLLGNKYSSFFGYSTFEVQTGSMADAINPGDWIIVKRSNDIKLGDIITFEKGNDYITHRVIESYKGTYVTKGDANNSKDDAINQAQIVGKVVKILPSFGIIRKTLFNPFVLIALIITLYLFGYILRNIKQNTKDSANNKDVIKKKIDSLIDKLIEEIVRRRNEKKQLEKSDVVESFEEKDEVIEEAIEQDDIEEQTSANLEEEQEEDNLVEDEEEIAEEDGNVAIDPENCDKTLYFRMVSVDKDELEKNDIEVPKDEEKIEEFEEKEVDDFSEVKEKLKLIQNKRKKFKNIIEKTIYVKREEINEIIDLLTKSAKSKVNENTIKDSLLDTYIDGKYYNFCGNVNVEYNSKNIISKIDNELKLLGENLIKAYKGSDSKYSEKVYKYVDIFVLINTLEQLDITSKDVPSKRESISNKLIKFFKADPLTQLELKNMTNSIIKTQRVHKSMIKYCLSELESNMFELEYTKVNNKKQLIGVSLKHNISFSKVYSDYIVDKTYSEGVIAEDKVIVLLNLLLLELLKNMLNQDFSKKYLVYVPGSVYGKANKLIKTFNLIEDEYAKNNIMILIDFADLASHKKSVKDLKKQGYHFAICFSTDANVKPADQKIISIADCIFVDKKGVKNTNIIQSIPDDLSNYIYNDDSINTIINDGGK